MTTAKATNNNKQKIDNSAVMWPEQIKPEQFRRQYAHDWAPNQEIAPRRKHVGPPAGKEERRAVMYKGRTDQDKQATRAPADPAPAAPTWGEIAAQLIARELETVRAQLRDAVARELAGAVRQAPTDQDQAPRPEMVARIAEEHALRMRLAPEYGNAVFVMKLEQLRALADAAPAAPPADQVPDAPAQRHTDRTRTKRAKADPAPAALPKPEQDMSDYGRRAEDRPKLTEKERRALRKQFAELDVFLNSEEMDDLDERKIDFGSHDRKYVKIFLNGVHKGWSARRAHNFASKETYGNQAIIV